MKIGNTGKNYSAVEVNSLELHKSTSVKAQHDIRFKYCYILHVNNYNSCHFVFFPYYYLVSFFETLKLAPKTIIELTEFFTL